MTVRGWALAGLAASVLLGVSGCGGEAAGGGVASAGGESAGGKKVSASPSRSVSPEDAQLEFARCMRKNGVDVSDPKAGEDLRIRARQDGDRGTMRAALEKCRHHLEAGGKLPDPNDPELRDKMLKFARCARDNGLDVPDPAGEDWYQDLAQDVDRATMEKALEVCGHLLPGRRGW